MAIKLTDDALHSRISIIRLANGDHAAVDFKAGEPFSPLFSEQCINPIARNLVGASMLMFQSLTDQCKALEKLIEHAESIGGQAELIVPVFTRMLQSCDLARRAAIVGITEIYASFPQQSI